MRLLVVALIVVAVAGGWVTLPSGLPHPTPQQVGEAVTWTLEHLSR